MKTDKLQDGPDGLHRLHRMLAATYGVEIPSSDYHAILVLLNTLGVSLRGIVELMGRFTRSRRGQLINDVNSLVLEESIVSETEVSRVRQLLVAHGYDDLLSEPSPKWVSGVTDLDPLEPCIPTGLRRYWSSLLRIFPKGIQTPKDYVTVLAVLRDERLSSIETEILMFSLTDRPKGLIALDIENLGTVLIFSEEQKALLKRQLAFDNGAGD